MISMVMVLSVPFATIDDMLHLAFFLTTGMVYFCLGARKDNP